jgi:hypothetical protein
MDIKSLAANPRLPPSSNFTLSASPALRRRQQKERAEADYSVATQMQISVDVARGLLVESTDATWLYGTSSEHAVMYQYNFWKARNVFAGMIHTESPYYQPTPKPPAPFADTVGKFAGEGIRPPEQWRFRPRCLTGSPRPELHRRLHRRRGPLFLVHDIHSGLWCVVPFWIRVMTCTNSFYSNNIRRPLVDTMNCQQSLVLVKDNFEHVWIHNLITIGATNMIESDGYKIKPANNLAVDFHHYWA